MAVPEPDEPDRPGNSGDREDVDTTFARIVAGWRAESTVPHWPEGADAAATSDADTPPEASPDGDATSARAPETDEGDDEHYQPPEPPPLPVLRPRTLGGLAMLPVGLMLLLAPGVPGLGQTTSIVLGVLAVAGAIGWLLMGLRTGPPHDSGWDDGARV